MDPEKVSLHWADVRPLDLSTKLLLAQDQKMLKIWTRRRQLSNTLCTAGGNLSKIWFIKVWDLSIAITIAPSLLLIGLLAPTMWSLKLTKTFHGWCFQQNDDDCNEKENKDIHFIHDFSDNVSDQGDFVWHKNTAFEKRKAFHFNRQHFGLMNESSGIIHQSSS